jgi:hypothetical protein
MLRCRQTLSLQHCREHSDIEQEVRRRVHTQILTDSCVELVDRADEVVELLSLRAPESSGCCWVWIGTRTQQKKPGQTTICVV